ncbi:MAG TPA: alpha/beta hydrolase, partial [Mycobacterium sp.]|nr:alpha/beta hydrolase [Mycobacterium sp.]
MTKSLQGAADLQRGAKHASERLTSRLRGTVAGAGLKVIPWIPAPAKRGLFGGRSIVIDGNTLDPTLQLMLSASRAVGIDGLVVDDDTGASRAQTRRTS